MTVETTAEPLVLIDTAPGELWVCEGCYLRALPPLLSSGEVRELHEQFAMEYRERGRLAEALVACERALEFGDSADTLALLALAYSELGHRTKAEVLYRRALAMDPGHFMATENLKLLSRASGSG